MDIRLNKQQIQGIVSAVKKHTRGTTIQLFLYGSRTNPQAKGGDIDLLLLFNLADDKKNFLSTKHVLLADMKKAIGDQKIDILFACQQDLTTDEFLKTIFDSAVLLYPENTSHVG